LASPLTLLLKKKRKLSRFVGKGIRVSSNQIARELSKKLGKPIVATSANISGRENCYSIQEVLKQGIKADLYLDAGKLKKVKPSTIFDVEKRVVIRKEPISLKEMMKTLK